MRQVISNADVYKEILFYSDGGEVVYTPLDERFLLFRGGRRDSTGEIEIKRLVVCDKGAVQKAKNGTQYFVPFAKKRKKGKYHRVLFSCETIYELMDRYRISYEPSVSETD